jgi:hypothetical protein
MRLKPVRLFMKYKAGFVLLVCVGLGLWLWRSLETARERVREQHQEHCLDNICEGDVPPNHDWLKEEVLKLNGQWFIGPKEYFSMGSNGAVFYWPSRTPGYRGGEYPERGQSFQDIAIEIFLRSNNIPPNLGVTSSLSLRKQITGSRAVSKYGLVWKPFG